MNFAEAQEAIRNGKAKAHALWAILSNEADRAGFALRPATWEGPGEYQRVEHEDGRDVFVRIPCGKRLPACA